MHDILSMLLSSENGRGSRGKWALAPLPRRSGGIASILWKEDLTLARYTLISWLLNQLGELLTWTKSARGELETFLNSCLLLHNYKQIAAARYSFAIENRFAWAHEQRRDVVMSAPGFYVGTPVHFLPCVSQRSPASSYGTIVVSWKKSQESNKEICKLKTSRLSQLKQKHIITTKWTVTLIGNYDEYST